MKLKEKYQIKIIDFDHQGRGLGKIDNKVIFIPNTIPGEIADIEITNIKKNYIEGLCLNIIDKSPDRTIPPCPYTNLCGGCSISHLNYQAQLKFKEDKVKNIVTQYLHKDNIVKNIIPSSQIINYRNKATFQVKNQIGFYKEKSNDIIPITKCLIADSKINKYLNIIKEQIPLNNISKIVIKSPRYNQKTMIIFELTGPINEKEIINIMGKYDISLITQFNTTYKTLIAPNYVIENLNDLQFIISPSAFFQVNTDQSIKLYNKVLTYIKPSKTDNILDLYCGTGSIGLYISPFVHSVLGVEINPSSIKDANKNKELNNITNVNFISSSTSTASLASLPNPTTIIVDPPRAGLDKQTIAKILAQAPLKIIYVSCDPLTLVRDLNILKESYDIIEITPVDMFPQTYHVECVCLLTRTVK